MSLKVLVGEYFTISSCESDQDQFRCQTYTYRFLYRLYSLIIYNLQDSGPKYLSLFHFLFSLFVCLDIF